MTAIDMAPLTAWLPARSDQDFDLIVKIVGPAASALSKDWPLIAQSLAHRGLSVMTQWGRLNGEIGDFVFDIRIAAQPFHSMGHGCDVLVYLGETVLDQSRFTLQPGSVLLWDPPPAERPHMFHNDAVIAYAVPFTQFAVHHEEGLAGKGLAALGTLLQLLGAPSDTLDRLASVVAAPRSFAAGVAFARSHIEKRDAYSIPSVWSDTTGGYLLGPEQAILLGYAARACECRTSCDATLTESPATWAATHLDIGRSLVSVLESDRHPGVQVYRGPQGKVMALLRGNDSAIASCLNGFAAPMIFVAADVPDIIRLIVAGHELIRSGLSDGVGILIEDTIARRQQSVNIRTLSDTVRRGNLFAGDTGALSRSASVSSGVEYEGDADAYVGYVSWGATQGVVRDAVALCRSFGLRAAGLYPKRIVPFRYEDMESFAETVGRVVIVESGQTQGYWDRLRASFSFDSSVLTPQPGQSLTPMDIFLREGLGAV
jgi:hypothetical protein